MTYVRTYNSLQDILTTVIDFVIVNLIDERVHCLIVHLIDVLKYRDMRYSSTRE